MLNFSRACFTAAVILLRQRMGGNVAGFVALLNMLTGLLLFAFIMLAARGLLFATGVGRFIDVPIVMPVAVLGAVLCLLWILRATGIVQTQGPLRDDDRPDEFTGHAAGFWSRRTNVRREWVILERLEPTLLGIAGLLLVLMPSTRAAGLFLVLMAIAVAVQTTRDRRAHMPNPNDTDYSGLAQLAVPFGQVDDLSIAGQLRDVPPEIESLFDEETQERLAALRQEQPMVAPPPPPMDLPDDVEGDLEPRTLTSAKSKNGPTLFVDAAIVAIIVNFAAGDVAGLYRWSPLRWTAAVQSVQTGGGSIGLFQSSNPNEPGKLDTGFLEVVDPDALRRIRKEQRETAIREAAASLASVERALESQKRAVDDRIGVPLSLSASTPLFDELLLTKDSAAEAWSSLLSIAGRLATRIETARETLGRARGSSESPTLDELQQLAADATGWTEDADRMATYIEHLAVMITNLRTERLLQQDRSGG